MCARAGYSSIVAWQNKNKTVGLNAQCIPPVRSEPVAAYFYRVKLHAFFEFINTPLLSTSAEERNIDDTSDKHTYETTRNVYS